MDQQVTNALQRYGAILAGLLIGLLARYGLTLNEGKKLTWLGVLADVLLLGMLGLIAITIADWLQLHGNARVLVGALSGASGERLVRLARDRFMKRAEQEADRLVGAARAGDVIEVPAGTGLPDALRVQSETPDNQKARLGNTLQSGFRAVTREAPPVDQIELLRRLDKQD